MKECTILGYGTYNDKETKEEKIRVVIAIDPQKENYEGLQPAVAFLDYSDSLKNELHSYLTNKGMYKAYYETTDNIFTGKTKISNIIIK